MTAIELLKEKLSELDALCAHLANYPDEFHDWEIAYKQGEINALLELLNCPETGNGVYRFTRYYANEEHRDDFTRDPHLEALKAAFDEWLAKVEA